MIKKAIITTFNKKLFDEYANQMIKTYGNKTNTYELLTMGS